jgi:hypothetical protein
VRIRVDHSGSRWTIDFSNLQTHARNFFDHDVLGNSNIFFPLSIERARIHGWESALHSPRIKKRVERVDLYLTYSNQMAEGAGIVTGGLLSDPLGSCVTAAVSVISITISATPSARAFTPCSPIAFRRRLIFPTAPVS